LAERARPTLRCLREDLGLAVPRVDTPLEEATHPLLAKAAERFAGEQPPQERIAAVDDQVLFKVKVQRWRGAVWIDAGVAWLVAAGSLLDGRENAAMLDGAALGIQVLADQGHETYVAIRIIGSVPRRLVATILSLVPGCQADAWMSDYAMPERAVAPKSRSGPTSWTPPPPRSSSTTSHDPADRRCPQSTPDTTGLLVVRIEPPICMPSPNARSSLTVVQIRAI
jgi:hypothetical protein